MNVIALDIGTSHCKAIIVNEDGKVLKTFQISTKPLEPQPGWNEQNVENIFETVVLLLQQSFAFCEHTNIACVSFSTAMHSFLAVDKNGKPLMNMLTWADLRSAEYAHDLKKKKIASTIYDVTGTPIHAMSPLCKLLWLKNEKPAVFEQAGKFISIKEYIFFRLFGKYIVDYSIASATGLFDVKHLCWYDEALKLTDIKKSNLSTPVSTTHFETDLLIDVKEKLRLKEAIPFVIGASDGALANLGCGTIQPDKAAVTIGTSGAARVITNKFVTDKKQRLFCYYIDDKMYITGGAVNNGGIVLQWFAEKILNKNLQNEESYNTLFHSTTNIKAGSDGLIFLPYIMGERSPMWDENAKAAFIGLTSMHTQAHLLKALLEGICFGLTEVLEALEETTNTIKTISLNGGVIQSEEWIKLFANIAGKTIMINNAADASALGAAFMGMKAVGMIKDFNGVDKFLASQSVYEPDMDEHKKYKKYFSIYKSLYKLLKPVFNKLKE